MYTITGSDRVENFGITERLRGVERGVQDCIGGFKGVRVM